LEEIVRVLEGSDDLDPDPSAFSFQEKAPHREKGNQIQARSVINGARQTPEKLEFRMPAEWEPHEATWIGWPHNTTDWPGKMSAIQWVYGEIVRHLSAGELVRILVNNKAHELKAWRVLDRVGVLADRVEFVRIPTNRGWARDFGPIFLKHGDPQAQMNIAHLQFNAWARYPDWQKDNRIPERVAAKFHIPLVPVTQQNRRVVLEGGSIDVNGQGTLLTTEECLLDGSIQVRNAGFSRQDYEEVFRRYLGITQVLWLGNGIAGDDTHGHVDDLCRFVDPYTVVLCQESNAFDANYRSLAENRERLEGMRCEDGRKVGIVPLPMPAPLYFEGQRLPASYANFYIGNTAVLVPTFNDPNDRVALGILSDLFSDRTVVGIHAVDLVWGFGTIHCLTQQQPAL
jgi:agmatine deiminase